MTLFAVVLLLNAAFNALVWPRFYSRVARDPRARDESGKATAFLKAHAFLTAIALVLALVSLLTGLVAVTGVL